MLYGYKIQAVSKSWQVFKEYDVLQDLFQPVHISTVIMTLYSIVKFKDLLHW